jgi:hypothetical protein
MDATTRGEHLQQEKNPTQKLVNERDTKYILGF